VEFFFMEIFPLLAVLEIVADNSKTPPRLDAFFQVTQESAAETFSPAMFLRASPPSVPSVAPPRRINSESLRKWNHVSVMDARLRKELHRIKVGD